MTLTLMSLLCASKRGSICRNASLRLLAAAMVRVSGAACTGFAVQKVIANTPRNSRLLNGTLRRVIKYLLVIVMKFIIRLEIELVLHIDPIFDEVSSESRLTLERKPVRRTPAASHCEVGVVDDEPIVVGAVETIVDGGAELFGQVMFLFCRWIQDPISDCELELPGDDVFADLDVPAPGLAEIHRGALDKGFRDRCEVERKGSGIRVPYTLVPVVPFCLERPALVLCDEIRFIGLEIVDASAKESAVFSLGHCLSVRAIDDVGAC